MTTRVRKAYAQQSRPQCHEWIIEHQLVPVLYTEGREPWCWDAFRAHSYVDDIDGHVDLTYGKRHEMRKLMAEGFYGERARNATIDVTRVFKIQNLLGNDPAAAEWWPPWPTRLNPTRF